MGRLLDELREELAKWGHDQGIEEPDEGERRVRLALDSAQRNAGDEWTAAALDLVWETAEERQRFTVEDVPWHRVGEPHNRRARGAVMRAAVKAGSLRAPTTSASLSVRKTHKRPITVWESCVHGGRDPQ